MSQFNDDKLGPVDPLQKTLTNFVISGASKKVMSGNSSLDSDVSDKHLMFGTEIDLPIDGHDIFHLDTDRYNDFRDPSASNQLPDLDREHCTLNSDVGGMEKIHKPLSNKCPTKVRI